MASKKEKNQQKVNEIMNKVSQEAERILNNDEYFRKSVTDFIARPLTNSLRTFSDEDEFLDYAESTDTIKDLAFIQYFISRKTAIFDIRNTLDRDTYNKLVEQLTIYQDMYNYNINVLTSLGSDDYYNRTIDLVEASKDELETMASSEFLTLEERDVFENMLAAKNLSEKIANTKMELEHTNLVEKISNREAILDDEDLASEIEDYIEVDVGPLNYDPTAQNRYHYFDYYNNQELSPEDGKRAIREGQAIVRYQGARCEGYGFNIPNQRTGKLETREAHREFSYHMQKSMKENIRMLKDLQKDLLDTDPWLMTTNTDEFRNLKTSIKAAIRVMEICDKYPINKNMEAVGLALSNMHRLATNYSVRKENDFLASGKKRDQKRFRISDEIAAFSNPERREELKENVFHFDPLDLTEKLREKYPNNPTPIDFANQLRGLKEISKMIPNDEANREAKVGVTRVIKEITKGIPNLKDVLLNECNMTKQEVKDLENVYKEGIPKKNEANVGVDFAYDALGYEKEETEPVIDEIHIIDMD